MLIHDYTSCNIPRTLLKFAVPLMLSNALQVLYSIVDMVVIGQFYEAQAALAAVTVASQITNLVTMISVGFSTGAQVYLAQIIGANERDKLNSTIGTLFTLMGLLGAAFTVLLPLLRAPLLGLVNAPPEALAMAKQYMAICGGGMLCTFGYNMISAVLRGLGDARHPFIFILIASVINIVLDIVFVLVFGWGVAGVAAATVIGQGFSFIYAIFYLYRRRESFGFDFRRESFRLHPERARMLTRISIPFAVQASLINISILFVASLVNPLGYVATEVFGIGVKLDDIVIKTTNGISYAMSSMIGQNFAAGKPERCKRIMYWGWLYSAICYAIYIFCFLRYTEAMFGLFTDDAEVIALCRVFSHALAWGLPAMALLRGCNGFIQGIGFSSLSMWLGLLDGLVLRVALSYLIGIVWGQGLFGFFLGFGLAAYGASVPGAIYFLSGAWRKRRALAGTQGSEQNS